MRPVPGATIARLAAVAALLTAVTACDLGSSPPPVQRQVPADPTAVPQATPAAVPRAPLAAVPPAPSAAVSPPAAPGVTLPLAPAAAAAKPPAAAEQAPADSLPPPHAVAPISDDELRRKRAEWQELQRMQEQGRANVEAWERSRRSAAGGPAMPRVGDAQPTASQSEIRRMQDAMRAWYRQYSGRSVAVTLALSQYSTASSAQPLDPSRLRDACGKLLAASTALLDDPQARRAPVDNVSAALSTAYTEIRATAKACLTYRDEDRAAHLAAALRAMAAAGTALRPYGLTP